MSSIYLDNSATTKPYKEVLDEYVRVSNDFYENPSALHTGGVNAEKIVNGARDIIAKSIHANSDEIIFTAGGTESDNIAIIGAAYNKIRQGKHIITSKIEHHGVLKTCEYLEGQGFEVTYLNVNKDGIIDVEQLEKSVRDDTILITIMLVNNETGIIQPIEKIKKLAPNAIIHTDAVQGYGKLNINVKDMDIDLMSVSAHKIHGPKGVGALYIKKGIKLNKVFFGGAQENGLRPGTLNTPAIAGFAKAVEIMTINFDEDVKKVQSLREYFKHKLLSRITGITINGDSVNIVSVTFDDIRAEVLLHTLESKNIYVSTGSACTSRSKKISHVMEAMGNFSEGTIRISLSVFNTTQEIDIAVDEMVEAVEFLRKFKRR